MGSCTSHVEHESSTQARVVRRVNPTENPRERYTYTPLDATKREIRLVRLHGGRGTDPIRCSMTTHAWGRVPKYAALSYCWGDDTRTTEIVVDGKLFAVTKNLRDALHQIRGDTYGDSNMWIDAVCINQSDNDEKSSQIPLMGQIYQRAHDVVAWLGEQEDGSALALIVMGDLGSLQLTLDEREEDEEGLFEIRDNAPRDLGNMWEGIEPYLSRDKWDTIQAFFSRPYWRRMWILQELIVARRGWIHCGTRTLSFNLLLGFVKFISILLADVNRSLLSRSQALQIGSCGVVNAIAFSIASLDRSALTYQRLMSVSAGQLCKDPRDKLYALVGLAALGRDAVEVVPNYAKDAATVYRDFVVTYSSAKNMLNLLVFAGRSKHTDDFRSALPSWAVDFTYREREESLDRRRDASRGIAAQWSFSCNSTRLDTLGILADKVLRVVRIPSITHIMDVELESYLEELCEPWGQRYSYPTGMPKLQAFFRALFKDLNGQKIGQYTYEDEDGQITHQSDREKLTFFENAAKFLANLVAHRSEEDQQNIISEIWPRVFKEFLGAKGSPYWLNWSLTDCMVLSLDDGESFDFSFISSMASVMFITESGYMGVGPEEVAAHDIVSIVPGCNTPLLLRREEEEFVLISDCYVHGMMRGELAGKIRAGTLETKNIRIQ